MIYYRSPQCDECDDASPFKRHPVDYAIDGTNNWWQSPSLAKGLHYEWVTLTLDLRQVICMFLFFSQKVSAKNSLKGHRLKYK